MPANNLFSTIILNGQSQSNPINMQMARLVGLVTPAVFEPASISFLASADEGVTYNAVYDEAGDEVVVVVGVGRYVRLTPMNFYGFQFMKIRGGTAGAPTVVGANRIINLISDGY